VGWAGEEEREITGICTAIFELQLTLSVCMAVIDLSEAMVLPLVRYTLNC